MVGGGSDDEGEVDPFGPMGGLGGGGFGGGFGGGVAPVGVKRYEMGVTQILSWDQDENLFFVGSYDESGYFIYFYLFLFLFLFSLLFLLTNTIFFPFCPWTHYYYFFYFFINFLVTLYDKRMVKRQIAQTSVGGGVWRIKPHPMDSSLLLIAGMHSGFHVVKWNNSDGSFAFLSHPFFVLPFCLTVFF